MTRFNTYYNVALVHSPIDLGNMLFRSAVYPVLVQMGKGTVIDRALVGDSIGTQVPKREMLIRAMYIASPTTTKRPICGMQLYMYTHIYVSY